MTGSWELFPHDADIGVRGFGASIAEAFSEAAHALTAVITSRPVQAQEGPFHVHCEAPDSCILLADWLNALVYEMAVRGMLFGRFEVRIEGLALDARIWGEAIDAARHRPAVEVKGATYTGIEVIEAEGRWTASCIVDV